MKTMIYAGYIHYLVSSKRVPRRRVCQGCLKDYADPPSKLCPGCQAYKEHQS